jgi:asparagine synthase (glutamine-hydrolysing)
MMTGYLGGMLRRTAAELPRPTAPPAGGLDWSSASGDSELFLRCRGDGARAFTWDGLLLLVRGYVRAASAAGPPDAERVAEELRCHYLEHGTLAVGGLEGSFSLALLDAAAGRVVLYRNVVGAGFTYYHAGPGGLLFGSNLADLVDAAGVAARPNRDVLPGFFLYRCVPGRDTLFEGFHRLLPGEQLTWDARGFARVQRQTLGGLRAEVINGDALVRLDATMAAVLGDCAAHRPGAANLLSGGVDSSYLQAVWNRVAAGDDLPPSVSVSVDHPRTWQDTDYAVTAAEELGTRHTLVPADGPYAAYLLDTLAATGEPPNHVQTAYFGHLARAMVARGLTAGVCGEGADSLFGLGLATDLHHANLLRATVPTRLLRRGGARLAALLGRASLAGALRLADRVTDYDDPEHPINRVASFTDGPSVRSCFGARAVAEAAARRRALAEHFGVADDPQDRLHAAGFLGEAMDSASLWATLFNRAGAELLCPFLDSRVIRLAMSLAPEVRYRFRRPKDLLKQALAREAPGELATRGKLGFGQPIFEWLAPGGQLRPLAEQIGRYDFLDRGALGRALARPNWFLYSLLCYDLWHKLFIDRSLPRPALPPGDGAAGAPAWAPAAGAA